MGATWPRLASSCGRQVREAGVGERQERMRTGSETWQFLALKRMGWQWGRGIASS